MVPTLEDQASGKADGVSENHATKAEGLLNQVKSFGFVATTALLSDRYLQCYLDSVNLFRHKARTYP